MPASASPCGTLSYIVDLEEHCLYLQFLFVHEEYRRQGLASQLLLALANRAFHWRCRKILLDNVLEDSKNNKLYEKAGFSYVSAGQGPEMVGMAHEIRRTLMSRGLLPPQGLTEYCVKPDHYVIAIPKHRFHNRK
jgi:RimJ/RimL family protein N-acetyltransferase